MECILPLGHRLIDLAHHPLGFLLLPSNLYKDFIASIWDGQFMHTLPALALMAAVFYRLWCSQRFGSLRHSLRCKMHKNFFYVCNVFCLHWLVNMTLVSFLSLQDFLICTAQSRCQAPKRPGFLAGFWTKTEPCPSVSTNLSLAVVSGISMLTALVLWKPDILLGYMTHQLRKRHALANWLSEMVFGAASRGGSQVQEQGDLQGQVDGLELQQHQDSYLSDDVNDDATG